MTDADRKAATDPSRPPQSVPDIDWDTAVEVLGRLINQLEAK